MTDIQDQTVKYFAKKFAKHGLTSSALDYNSRQSHYLRMGIIANEIDQVQNFSVNEVGCGYGAFLDVLFGSGRTNFDYHGYDLVLEMIKAGRETWTSKNPRLKFTHAGTEELQEADFTVASGVFNMKQQTELNQWHEYVLENLKVMVENTRQKVIVNFLTSYSDAEFMRDDLYYPDPKELFDFGMQLTGSVAVRHNYGLYDFTLIINKPQS